MTFKSRHLRIGPRITAVRTMVFSEMSVSNIFVFIFVFAVDAVRSVRLLLDSLFIDRLIHSVEYDLVVYLFGKTRRERAVRVQTYCRVRRILDADLDIVECMRHFAVTVELVAEYVRNEDEFRIYILTDFFECRLITFDECCFLFGFPVGVQFAINSAVIPLRRFAPDLFARNDTPQSDKVFDIILAVVVLPFVPVTTIVLTSFAR